LQTATKSIENTRSANFYVQAKKMMHFIYDSLETVKKLKHPTKQDYINLTIGIFALVIVAGLFFVFADTIFSGVYKVFYTIMQ
jgi:preprotein translocase SecE subunit